MSLKTSTSDSKIALRKVFPICKRTVVFNKFTWVFTASQHLFLTTLGNLFATNRRHLILVLSCSQHQNVFCLLSLFERLVYILSYLGSSNRSTCFLTFLFAVVCGLRTESTRDILHTFYFLSTPKTKKPRSFYRIWVLWFCIAVKQDAYHEPRMLYHFHYQTKTRNDRRH